MRLVIISMLGPADLYVLRHVLERWPTATILRPVDVRRPGTPPRRRRWHRLLTAPHLLARGWLRAQVRRRIDRYADRTTRAALLGEGPHAAMLPPHLEVPVWALRDGTFATRLADLAPDILLLVSAPLLPPEILAVPRRPTVNLHHGIAPAYRGEGCNYHALAHEDWEQLGITLHRATPGIDRGALYVQARIALDPGDDDATVMVKGARLAAREVVALLEAMQHGRMAGRRQPRGRLWRYDDWTLRSWIRRAWRRHVLKRNPPHLEERVTRWYAPENRLPARATRTSPGRDPIRSGPGSA